MNFFQEAGKMALGSRLRKLSETITEDSARIYKLYAVDLEPRWFPVFFILAEYSQLGVSEIAQAIRQSHASVSQIVKEMKKKDLVQELKAAGDGRKNLISLTPQGQSLVPALRTQTTDVGAAVENLLGEMQYDLWKAIEELEFLLERQNLYKRVAQIKKSRESQAVQILDYEPAYQADFERLNVAWIEKYFKLEKKDLQTLKNPEEYILKPGGHILLAKFADEIVGACALLRMNETTYELAKMAVSPEAQGKNIGFLLGQASIRKARELGATRLFLESNTILKPAINLYHKLGFYKVTGPPSPYERSNIQMELLLTEDPSKPSNL